jgi:hypothetical protein
MRFSRESQRLARLNTLLELKIENERLQQHLSTLRAHSQQTSATHAAQVMGSYTGDDLSAHIAANLGLPTRPTIGGGDSSSRSQHYPLPHGYEPGGAFSDIASLEDEGDAEPRRKKVRHLHHLTSIACCHDTFVPSSKSLSGANSIFAILAVGLIPQNGERQTRHTLFLDHLLTSLGCRALAVQKHFATHVASDGQRRCANLKRRPKQVIRVTFRWTTQYLPSPVLITFLYL